MERVLIIHASNEVLYIGYPVPTNGYYISYRILPYKQKATTKNAMALD